MLKPNESKRDWFLFHMTPAGMARTAQPAAASDRTARIALTLLGGALAVGLLLAAYLGA